jgi:NitT/TauT family transport system substrate-binding protein
VQDVTENAIIKIILFGGNTMLRRYASFLVVLAIALTACAQTPKEGTGVVEGKPLTKIRLPVGYIPNVQFAPLYVAIEKGYFSDVGLEIEFDYSFETDGVALVGANEVQFAVVSGEQVLLARAQGLPVVYVTAWWQNYPVAVMSMSGTGILNPADLAGKKIGFPGFYGANYVGIRALLGVAGLKEEDVTLDSVGYNQVEALVSGQDEAVVIYANNEPIQLRNQGYEVDLIRVADYVQLASNGLITNEATVTDNPDLVRRMVQPLVKGVAYTLANPEEAYEICRKFVEGLDSADQVIQMEVLESSLEFWKAKRIGYSQPEAWENMQKLLLEMGMLTEPLDLSKAYTNDFLAGN